MPEPCSRCGAPRSDASPAGLCPRCLMGNALDSDHEGSSAFLSEEPGWVLETLATSIGPMPRVLLPDTVGSTVESAVVRPLSGEMPLQADRSVRVQLLGEIARGGMGAILKGRDPDLGRDVAVKVLLEAHRDKPELVRRFVEEAQIGGQLQHPGIVPVYELGTFGDSRPYFTMKLVKGRTLAELLADRPRPTDDRPRFVAMLLQVAQTVAYAHARGVIHRDLKPSNIMVGSFGEVQVMDWGLAKILWRGGLEDDAAAGLARPDEETVIATHHPRIDPEGDHSRAGSVLGTPSYMAPEQARGEVDRLDERCDVFALGSILAEVLTGEPAFTGRTGVEILRKSARGDLREAFARLDGSGADPSLVELTRRCLASEPEVRPSGAEEVADGILEHINSVHLRLREAELAQAAEHARAEEAKRTASAESARAEEAQRAASAAEARTVAERRARRLQVGLAASLIGLMALGGGGYAMGERQRAERSAKTALGVDEALADSARLRGEAKAAPTGDLAGWALAISAAKRAEGLLAQGEANAALRGRVAALLAQLDQERGAAAEKARQIRADRALLANLESVRDGRAEHGDWKRTDAEYAAAFRKAGIDLQATGSGRSLASSTEPVELAGYLDDWAIARRANREARADWRGLLAAARATDPDPWRDALRSRIGTKDAGALAEFRRLADDEKALDAQPSPSLILLARQLKYEFGDRERAARVLRRAVSLHPGDYLTRIELSAVHGASYGQAYEIYPRAEESVRHLTAAVAIRPASYSARYRLAAAIQGQRKYDEAIAAYREVLRVWPETAGAHVGIGVILKDQGKPDEAIAEFRETIRLQPGDVGAHSNLGVVLRDLGKLDESVAEHREAIRLQPDYAPAHNDLGLALSAQGKLDEALAEFREAVRLQLGLPGPHNKIVLILRLQGKLDEALAESREAIRLHPDDPVAQIELSVVLRNQGKLDEAAASCREAIRLQPDYAGGHYDLGIVLRDQGKLEEAAAAFREAIRLQPDHHEARTHLGITLNEQGKLDEAVTAFRDTLRLQPGLVWVRADLGNVLRVQGKLEEAAAEFRESIQIQPHFIIGYCYLGFTLQEQGDYAGGLEMLRRGHELGTRDPGWKAPSATWVAKAERLLAMSSRLPALLKGEERLQNVDDRVTATEMCIIQRFYAAAARFWAEALEADPTLGDDRQLQRSYDAACCAAMAGSGKGKDDPPLDEAARARLRSQALGWLRLEREAWAKQLLGGDASVRINVARTLRHWKVDADLAGIRDPEAIMKLPEAEREPWRAFWAGVDALLKEAGGSRP